MLDTSDEINSFLTLKKKSESELRVICEGAGITSNGDKNELIVKLMKLSIKGQADYSVPQAFALRTKNGTGTKIEGAWEFMQKARRLMFENRKRKEFSLLNSKRQSYKTILGYIECTTELLSEILDKKLLLPQIYQHELAELIYKQPHMFTVHLINKPSNNGKSFVMLHVEEKAVA
jgi:hypothetical protein